MLAAVKLVKLKSASEIELKQLIEVTLIDPGRQAR